MSVHWEELENRIFEYMNQAKSTKVYASLRKHIHEPWATENIFLNISEQAADMYQQLCEKLTPQHCLKSNAVYRCGYCGEWLKKRLDKRKGQFVLEHPVRSGWTDCQNYTLNGKPLKTSSFHYKKYSLHGLDLTKIYLPHPMFYAYFGYPDKYEEDTKAALLQQGYETFTKRRYFLLNGQHDVLDFALYRPEEQAVYFWDAKCWNGHWQKSSYFVQCLLEKFLAKRELLENSSEGKALKQTWKHSLEKTNKPYHYTRYGLIFPTKLSSSVRQQLQDSGIRYEVVYEKPIRLRKI